MTDTDEAEGALAALTSIVGSCADAIFTLGCDRLLTWNHSAERVFGYGSGASALDLTAVAEGVETVEQASDLQALGCPRGQGYYFARPAPPEVVARLICGAPLPG